MFVTFRLREDGELVHEELVTAGEHSRIDAIAKSFEIECMGNKKKLDVEFVFDPPLLVAPAAEEGE